MQNPQQLQQIQTLQPMQNIQNVQNIQNMQKKTLLEHKLWYNNIRNTIAMIGSGFDAGRHKEVCGS